jgi:hypothetical protein
MSAGATTILVLIAVHRPSWDSRGLRWRRLLPGAGDQVDNRDCGSTERLRSSKQYAPVRGRSSSVSTYPDRLERAVETYRRVQSPEDGGWGEDRVVDAPRSIVNTAEVLSVFKAAGTAYDDPAVQRGLAYLAEAMPRHWLALGKHPEARGPHARYAAFGLLGLTLYKPARHDSRWLEAQSAAVDWLGCHVMETGGWAEHPRADHPSLISTHAAIIGLERVCPFGDDGARAAELVRSARSTTASLAERNGELRWWPQAPGERRPSAAATSLAVLILSRGSLEDREIARRGIDWLMEHSAQWSEGIDPASNMKGSAWTHMTFSLALRAVLAPGSRVRADDPSFTRILVHLDELWCEEHGEWSHGLPGARPSPSGSCAAVLAHEALKRAWPFDPAKQVPSKRPRRRRTLVADPRTSIQLNGSQVEVRFPGNEVLADTKLPPALSLMFTHLCKRRVAGGSEETLEARTLSTGELADTLGVDPKTIRKYSDRINEYLRKDAARRERVVGDLVELQSTQPTLRERRWGLAAGVVVITNDAG